MTEESDEEPLLDTKKSYSSKGIQELKEWIKKEIGVEEVTIVAWSVLMNRFNNIDISKDKQSKNILTQTLLVTRYIYTLAMHNFCLI